MALGVQSRATGHAGSLSTTRALRHGVYVSTTCDDDVSSLGRLVDRVAGNFPP